jgi:hypothetical protein
MAPHSGGRVPLSWVTAISLQGARINRKLVQSQSPASQVTAPIAISGAHQEHAACAVHASQKTAWAAWVHSSFCCCYCCCCGTCAQPAHPGAMQIYVHWLRWRCKPDHPNQHMCWVTGPVAVAPSWRAPSSEAAHHQHTSRSRSASNMHSGRSKGTNQRKSATC